MEKLFFVGTMCFIASVAAFAQDNEWGTGLNIGYDTNVFKPFLAVKGHYDLAETFTVATCFNHYFKDTMKEMGVEAKYQIIDGGRFVPMATIVYRF